mmetsp:Transcript_9470/g.43091  ORF Transcript_9470/g.43091 Transcript_9470/m.43091 type:complete len:315 (-) Transcript_9470:114-1058(-)
MPSASALKSKQAYNDKLCTLLDNHTRAFIVGADNVGSRQFMDIRAALRPQSTVLMGKNTMIRKCIKDYCERKGDNTWMSLYEKMVGNVGVIFTSGELDAVKEKIKEFVVPAPAKAGAIAQVDVTVEAGPTGMEPSQTNFFQTLNIATKINKGAIEILSDVKVLSKGDKVTTSAAALLGKLGVTPFFYGLEAMFVYDNGNVFDVAVLDISDEDITAMFGAGLKNIAALSLQANYPTIAAVPHAIINGYKNVLAIAVGTDYTFPLADKVKEYLANPGAFASAAPAAGGGGGGGAAAAKAPEPEEEEEEAMDFDLFD